MGGESFRPTASRTHRARRGCWAVAQAQVAAAKAQPVRAIQSSFDFHLRSTKPRADFLPGHAPALAIPTDGVIIGDLASHPQA